MRKISRWRKRIDEMYWRSIDIVSESVWVAKRLYLRNCHRVPYLYRETNQAS